MPYATEVLDSDAIEAESERARRRRRRAAEEEYEEYEDARLREERGISEGTAHGLGIAGFVCGLLAAVFVFMPCLWLLAVPLGLIGLILSAVSCSRSGFGVAGLVLSLIALALVVLVLAIISERLRQLGL
jgi:hypothetical protein